ncbi:MAG: hypothetical protein LBT86_05815 [Deltaproteobacteria bacterium]|jgi:hypothetical protein|nr:hypothetical protein [Deltaproteobacteria bacterium]
MNNVYRPSGHFDHTGLLIVPLMAAVFSSLLAIPYALSLWYCPVVYLGLVLPIIFVKLTALSGWWSVRRGKIRSSQLANMLGFLGAIPGFYIAWVAWGVLVDNIAVQGSVSLGWRNVNTVESSLTLSQLFSQALDPLDLLSEMRRVGAYGLWSVEGYVVSGYCLYVVWALEAVIYFIFSSRSFGKWAQPPYSERLNSWYPSVNLSVPLSVTDKLSAEAVFEGITKGRIGAILEAKRELNPDNASYLKVKLYYLPQAFDAFATINGYLLKNSGGHKKKVLIQYVKIPEPLAKNLYDQFQ